jgi:glucosamine kinase
MTKTILVGDVGSTKSTWWHNSVTATEIHLPGYNPVAHPSDAGKRLFDLLREETNGILFPEIWYYGAGVIDQSMADKVRQLLHGAFPESLIHVTTDLVGAAAAACGDEPGAVAILGTGSHAAVWDGQKVIRQAVSLGYILGDEGGGCDIGKALIQSYFYKEMPDDISAAMQERLPLDRTILIAELQTSSAPNQYLADFARVAVLNQDHPWIKTLISSRFNLFVNRHIVPLDPQGSVHIVGSIGCIFASLIKQELENSGLSVGSFIKDPALKLFERHLEHG